MKATRKYSPTIESRLTAGLSPGGNGCIEWTKARSTFGYGRITRGARGAGWAFTHRVAWELANGPIPDGMCVLHRCDNPPCCNPDHLFLGTLSDNTQDMIAKGRGSGHRPSGEAHPDARLSDTDVAEMRRLAPSVGNYAELGRLFGVSKQHARNIVIGNKRRTPA
jgi:hypothetical protein